MKLSEERYVKTYSACLELTDVDFEQKQENERCHAEINQIVNDWKEELAKIQTNNENTMHGHKLKLTDSKATQVKHREMLEENKHMMSMN